MRLRRIGACAVAVLALAGLSACRSKAGAAAFVGGHRISQSDVNEYLDSSFTAPSPSASAQPQEPPRSVVLDTIIQTRLMTEVLRGLPGGVPSESELAGLHDKALSFQYQVQQTGSQADDALRAALTKNGLTGAFLTAFLHRIELTQAVIDDINAQQPSDIANAVRKLGIQVSVNERYGSWDSEQESLGSTAQPAFLTLGSSAAPTPQP